MRSGRSLLLSILLSQLFKILIKYSSKNNNDIFGFIKRCSSEFPKQKVLICIIFPFPWCKFPTMVDFQLPNWMIRERVVSLTFQSWQKLGSKTYGRNLQGSKQNEDRAEGGRACLQNSAAEHQAVQSHVETSHNYIWSAPCSIQWIPELKSTVRNGGSRGNQRGYFQRRDSLTSKSR